MLVDVSVDCYYDGRNFIETFIYVMSRCIFQLETLKLVLTQCPNSIKENDELCNFPQMPKLKKLFVEYGTFDDGILVTMAYFTRASPYLQEFVLENKLQNPLLKIKPVIGVVANVRFQHEHIKVFKLCGYRGRPIDDAVLGFVLENFVVLEKIIIDPSGVNYCFDKNRRLKLENAARDVAKQHLQPQLPHRVELVIL
ncbi:PREDICTED: uncharacterized protein LOC105949894 [Erythranthe guttata]|uniref:uncharacterized protein LOC105949894 n=1 Tax=Erythranthe guttata TaxID=4155 RepID=UPI00064DEB70|nr:PREDICTED: uncharacterized protein LOC105949894 [Erythranthe guttata]|eukprot:XP_012828653.1 PREDICTED: uncharacterized protein LOC105949894 [Erythranthe guttata]